MEAASASYSSLRARPSAESHARRSQASAGLRRTGGSCPGGRTGPQPALLEFDLRLSAKALADFALDQGQSKSVRRRLAERWPAALSPVQDEIGLAAFFDRPSDFQRSLVRG